MTATRPLYFEVISNATNMDGHSNYEFDDHAFSFQMNRNSEESQSKYERTTSLVLETLQLEVAVESCLCLYIWGYFPMGKWRSSPLFPPRCQRGSLRVVNEKKLLAGISIGLEDMMPTTAWFDADSGWFCIGHKEPQTGATAVEFATGCLAVVVCGRLSSLWVRPLNWKDVAERYLTRERYKSDAAKQPS